MFFFFNKPILIFLFIYRALILFSGAFFHWGLRRPLSRLVEESVLLINW
jgi:hypothetical protein